MTYRPLLFVFGLLVLGSSACVAPQATTPMQQPTTTPGMAHTVYFWLHEGLSDDDLRDFERGVAALQEAPTVLRCFVGKPAATPSRGVVDNSFDYSLVLWFDDVAGHDAYQISPTHLKFVAEQEAKFDVVKVFDNVLIK